MKKKSRSNGVATFFVKRVDNDYTVQLHQICVGEIPGDTSDPFFLPQATHKTKKLVKDLLFHQDKVCTNSQICLLEIYPADAKSQISVSNCPIYDKIFRNNLQEVVM